MSIEYLSSDLAPDGRSFIHHYILWPDENPTTDPGSTTAMEEI